MTSLQSVGKRSLRFIAELCSTYTPEGREAALLPLLESELRRMGASIEIFPLVPGRSNILALWGQPQILFSTHLDVVPPDLPCRLGEDFVEARGACDAKGQIAAQLAAIELLLEAGIRDIAWLGVAGEEGDSIGAKESVKLAPRFESCRAIIVGEPTESKLATGQKGFQRLRLRTSGKTAHGGMPELGSNAIEKLLRWLKAAQDAQPAKDPILGPEVWNLGLIEGGRAANVVPDQASAELTLRTVPGHAIREALDRALPPGGELKVLSEDPWSFFDAPAGFPSASMPFGSDLPAMRAIAPKAAAILAGPGTITVAHTESEKITLAELVSGIELFRDLGSLYLGGTQDSEHNHGQKGALS